MQSCSAGLSGAYPLPPEPRALTPAENKMYGRSTWFLAENVWGKNDRDDPDENTSSCALGAYLSTIVVVALCEDVALPRYWTLRTYQKKKEFSNKSVAKSLEIAGVGIGEL